MRNLSQHGSPARMGLLLLLVACQGDGAVAALAGTYAGTYAGSESGPAGCTIEPDGRLTAWAESSTAGRFAGAGRVDPSGDATFSVSGAGAASEFTITFEGRFASEAERRFGAGTWRSSSGFTGTWQVENATTPGTVAEHCRVLVTRSTIDGPESTTTTTCAFDRARLALDCTTSAPPATPTSSTTICE